MSKSRGRFPQLGLKTRFLKCVKLPNLLVEMWKKSWPELPGNPAQGVYVERNLLTGSQDTQDLMVKRSRKNRLNRIVVPALVRPPEPMEALFSTGDQFPGRGEP